MSAPLDAVPVVVVAPLDCILVLLVSAGMSKRVIVAVAAAAAADLGIYDRPGGPQTRQYLVYDPRYLSLSLYQRYSLVYCRLRRLMNLHENSSTVYHMEWAMWAHHLMLDRCWFSHAEEMAEAMTPREKLQQDCSHRGVQS